MTEGNFGRCGKLHVWDWQFFLGYVPFLELRLVLKLSFHSPPPHPAPPHLGLIADTRSFHSKVRFPLPFVNFFLRTWIRAWVAKIRGRITEDCTRSWLRVRGTLAERGTDSMVLTGKGKQIKFFFPEKGVFWNKVWKQKRGVAKQQKNSEN